MDKAKMQRFEGPCDVCGESISLDYDPAQGMIEYACGGGMKLVTYMDKGMLRTLMVDRFLDRYNTAGGWMVKYVKLGVFGRSNLT